MRPKKIKITNMVLHFAKRTLEQDTKPDRVHNFFHLQVDAGSVKDCNGATEDGPLGAPHRGNQQVEPLQRRSGSPTAFESNGMTEHAADKPPERSSKRKDQTPKNPTAVHVATTMTASMNKKKQMMCGERPARWEPQEEGVMCWNYALEAIIKMLLL
jgi:hypothetical protein